MHLNNEKGDHVHDLEIAQEMCEYPRKLHQPTNGKTKILSYKTMMNLEMHEGEKLDTFIK